MRQIYILRANEEDGRVLDALPDPKMDPEEIENPTCPSCGGPTLLAYTEEGDYNVLTWFCLSEEGDEDQADGWYLICQNLKCPYEERVERVMEPAGAEFFNLETSHFQFDEETGLACRNPSDMKSLIAYLTKLQRAYGYRKLEAFLDEANWRYDEGMEELRKWADRIPTGRRIEFQANGVRYEARLIAATEEKILVQTGEGGEMICFDLEQVAYFSPRRFDQEEAPKKPDPIDFDNLITFNRCGEYVVVQGYHLWLQSVDRFGQYSVSTHDPEVAAALNLTLSGNNFWTANLRRHQIEARYEIEEYARIQGHWVTWYGETSRNNRAAVWTEDPDVAQALGMELEKSWWWDEERQTNRVDVKRWHGIFPQEQIEEVKQIRTYHWPIPEAEGSGTGGSSQQGA